MILNRPNTYDWEAYHMLPVEDRSVVRMELPYPTPVITASVLSTAWLAAEPGVSTRRTPRRSTSTTHPLHPEVTSGDPDENGDFQSYGPRPERPELPEILKGIAKYMMVEFIGDKIVEVSPRWAWRVEHMVKVYAPDGSFTWDYGNHYPQDDPNE
jgi:hypothetical protein